MLKKVKLKFKIVLKKKVIKRMNKVKRYTGKTVKVKKFFF